MFAGTDTVMSAESTPASAALEALDIAIAVLSTLERPRDLLCVACVNHNLEDAVKENLLWHQVRRAPCGCEDALRLLEPFPQRFVRLRGCVCPAPRKALRVVAFPSFFATAHPHSQGRWSDTCP